MEESAGRGRGGRDKRGRAECSDGANGAKGNNEAGGGQGTAKIHAWEVQPVKNMSGKGMTGSI